MQSPAFLFSSDPQYLLLRLRYLRLNHSHPCWVSSPCVGFSTYLHPIGLAPEVSQRTGPIVFADFKKSHGQWLQLAAGALCAPPVLSYPAPHIYIGTF